MLAGDQGSPDSIEPWTLKQVFYGVLASCTCTVLKYIILDITVLYMDSASRLLGQIWLRKFHFLLPAMLKVRTLEKALVEAYDPNRRLHGWARPGMEMDREDFIDLAKVSEEVPGKTPAQVFLGTELLPCVERSIKLNLRKPPATDNGKIRSTPAFVLSLAPVHIVLTNFSRTSP